jgi:hypothetical protein
MHPMYQEEVDDQEVEEQDRDQLVEDVTEKVDEYEEHYQY